jgi:hypothetical protein
VPEPVDDRVRRLAEDLSRVSLPSASNLRRTALRRRRARVVAAAAAVVVAGGVAVLTTTLGSGHRSSLQVVTNTPTTTASRTTVTSPPTTAAAPTTTPTSVPTTSNTAAPPTSTSTGEQLPISVQSDSQMKAEGNNGPSSSILLPTSCRLTGTTVTADGTYTNDGFVPNVYNRYGDIIVLYVFAAPSPGYAQGIQLGVSGVSESPVVGSPAPWNVSLSITPSLGVPARCVVAAQPTHDVQLAP